MCETSEGVLCHRGRRNDSNAKTEVGTVTTSGSSSTLQRKGQTDVRRVLTQRWNLPASAHPGL